MCPKSRGQNPPDDHDYANSLMHRGILEKKWSKPRFMSLDLGGCSPSMTNAKVRQTRQCQLFTFDRPTCKGV